MRRAATLFAVLALGMLAACSTPSGEKGSEPGSSPRASRSIEAKPSPGNTSSGPVVDAERVKTRLDPMIDDLRSRFGEGANSPCSSSSSKLFTSRCSEAVEETGRIARAAVDLIQSSAKYETLRSVTDRVLTAERGYAEAQCSQSPSDPSQRAKCLDHGAVIAQAPVDLHQGVVAGLLGN